MGGGEVPAQLAQRREVSLSLEVQRVRAGDAPPPASVVRLAGGAADEIPELVYVKGFEHRCPRRLTPGPDDISTAPLGIDGNELPGAGGSAAGIN